MIHELPTQIRRIVTALGLILLLSTCKPIAPTPTITHTVTFKQKIDSNSDGPSVKVKVKLGDKVDELVFTPPAKWHYVFQGWYLDDGKFSTKFDFATPIKSDITLYAKWTKAAPVFFHENADDLGGGPVKESLVALASAITPLSPDPRSYRAFSAWCSDPQLTNIYSFPPISSLSEITLYAKWLSPSERWTKISAPVFPNCYGHASAVFAGKIWVFGGKKNSTLQLTNEIWSSTDGMNWKLETSSSPFSARMHHAAVVFNNKLWIFGGQTESVALGDTWSSADGINWTRITDQAAFEARFDHAAVVFNGKIWILGGTKGGQDHNNDVWSSSDGITWIQSIQSDPNQVFSARSQHAALVFGEKLWVIGGQGNSPIPVPADTWSSTDGTTWTRSTAFMHPAVYDHASSVFDDKLWIFGGVKQNNNLRNEVWSLPLSNPGPPWSQSPPSTQTMDFIDRNDHTAEVFNNRVWIIGGQGLAAEPSAPIIYTP